MMARFLHIYFIGAMVVSASFIDSCLDPLGRLGFSAIWPVTVLIAAADGAGVLDAKLKCQPDPSAATVKGE